MAVPAASDAHIRRDGDALVFAGALDRAAAAALWAEAAAQLPGVQRFVLTNVTTVDSAGLALLAELAARAQRNVHIVDGVATDLSVEPNLARLARNDAASNATA